MNIILNSTPYPFITITFESDKERQDFIHNVRNNEVVSVPFGDGSTASDPVKKTEQIAVGNVEVTPSPSLASVPSVARIVESQKSGKKTYKNKVCAICGKDFTPHGPRQTKCDDCAKESKPQPTRNETPKVSLVIMKKCKECGLDFEATDGRQRRCPACKERALHKEARKKEPSKNLHICESCGHEFESRNKNARYCSRHCYHTRNADRGPTKGQLKKQASEEKKKRQIEELAKQRVCPRCHRHFIPTEEKEFYCPKCTQKAKSIEPVKPLEPEEPYKFDPNNDECVAKLPPSAREQFLKTVSKERKDRIMSIVNSNRRY